MKPLEIKPGIYWIGAKDWNVRDFHGYKTQRGTTYNAFLIMDEKITLIDTVKETHCSEMLSRIAEIVDPSRIDYVVTNHVELDHSGSLPEIMKLARNAELITSEKGIKGLGLHFDTAGWKMRAVKSGEELAIGSRTLKFVPIPMVHWPDSMVTYIASDRLLMPNDAFGQHLACEALFNDEFPHDITMYEAAKYYANIIYPFGKKVLGVLDLVHGLDIDMIAPSHGLIWRTRIPEILDKYAMWAKGDNRGSAVVVYDSMWGSTEKMAHAIKAGFEDKGIPVTLRSLKQEHISDVVTDVLEAKYVVIGSPTLNNQVLPTVAGFLNYIEGLGPSNKVGFAFGSYGWYKDGLKEVTRVMEGLKWQISQAPVAVNYRPQADTLAALRNSIHEIVR
jgi:flavorubredoxin